MRAFTARAVVSALAPGASITAEPAAGWPFRRVVSAYDSLPISTRATSPSRTTAPSACVLSTMALNWSGVCSRDIAVTVAFRCCVGADGRAPISPTDTCVFCAVMAAVTSDGISW
ncbi:hypothetical protein D3C86_1118320 [compost metagenome]